MRWMKLEPIIQSEVSQKEKHHYSILMHIYRMVKQDMARVNIDILGITELKLTGMGEFNSDDHYIYYHGQESIRTNGVAIIVNKRVRNAVLGCNLKTIE